MPTKTYYILEGPQNVKYTGKTAIRVVLDKCGPFLLRKDTLPPNWNKLTKRERLVHLAANLPPEWVLYIFTEPKHTRKNYSLYRNQLKKEERLNEKPAQGLDIEAMPIGQAVAPRVRARDEFNDNIIEALANRVIPIAPPPPGHVGYRIHY